MLGGTVKQYANIFITPKDKTQRHEREGKGEGKGKKERAGKENEVL